MGKRKTVILLGGTGFIGSALADELIRREERVISISRNIPEKQEAGIEYHAFDIAAQPEKLAEVLGIGNTIFLLIGQNHAGFDTGKEVETLSKILDRVKISSPEKVFFTSSVLVYGECNTPADEEYTLNPKEAYSEYKVLCERMVQEKLSGIPVGILRLANVYGSEKNRGFVGLVFKKMLEGSDMKVNSDGMQERDYIFVDDVVSAMIAVKEKLKESDTINIATGKSETLLDVMAVVSEVTGKEMKYEITGIPLQEVEKSRIDSTKLVEKYGFVPRVFLKEGIQKTWERYNKKV